MVTDNAEPGSDLAVLLAGETAITPIAVMPSVEGSLDVSAFLTGREDR
jgi:hypothetical protein